MSLKEQIIENFAVCLTNQCLEKISKAAFEIVDDSDSPKSPCRIVEVNETGQFRIENPNGSLINFLKIDHCLLTNNVGKRCDFAAFTDNEFIFVELKAITGNDTSKKLKTHRNTAYEQLENTINIFQEKLADLSLYSKDEKLYAIVSVDRSKASRGGKTFQRMPVATTNSQINQFKFYYMYKVILCVGDIYVFS